MYMPPLLHFYDANERDADEANAIVELRMNHSWKGHHLQGHYLLGGRILEIGVDLAPVPDFCGGLIAHSAYSERYANSWTFGIPVPGSRANYTQEIAEKFIDLTADYTLWKKQWKDKRKIEDYGMYILAAHVTRQMVISERMSLMATDTEYGRMQRFAHQFERITQSAPVVFKANCKTVPRAANNLFKRQEPHTAQVKTSVTRGALFLNPNSMNEAQWIQMNLVDNDEYKEEDEYDAGVLHNEYGQAAEGEPPYGAPKQTSEEEHYLTHASGVINRITWRNG